MKRFIIGTVAAMIVSFGVMGHGMTAYAATENEVSLHTTQKTFEVTDREEPHEITDEQREQLRKNLKEEAEKRSNSFNWGDAIEATEGLLDLFEQISRFIN
ncbi:MAG: hypothetical protein MJ133_08620 [Lachnospiraceae bacterium]|nr:hypothetical protein [Lachnospiraceae bacterium]